MSKFAAIAKGARARRRDVKFTTLHGVETACDLRVLTATEHEECLKAASSVAKAAGVEPSQGNIVFDFALACEVVARGAVDPDVQDRDEPFFGSVAEVKDGLDRERVFLLFDRQNALQDEVSPRLSHMDLEQAIGFIYEHASVPEGRELPFESWQPVAQRAFVRFSVDLLVKSEALKSLFTSDSSLSSSASSPSSPPS